MKKEDEWDMAVRIQRLTGRPFSTCRFCVRYKHGNFDAALKMCSDDPSEDGW